MWPNLKGSGTVVALCLGAAARVRGQATDGSTYGLVPSMDRARPQGAGSDLIEGRALTTTAYFQIRYQNAA
jgi:hypothetical protein